MIPQPARRRDSAVRLPLAAIVTLCLTPIAICQGTIVQPPATQIPGDSRITSLLESLGHVRAPQSAAISPDGNYVAWTITNARASELHLTGVAPAGAQDAAW